MNFRTSVLIFLTASLLLTSCSSKPSLQEMDEWDLVWISDSSGWDVAEIYASMVEEDTGKKVNVMDNWMGGLSAGYVYTVLKGEPTPNATLEHLGELIKEAEIVVFYANPEESWEEGNPADWMCVSSISLNYVNNCDMETFDTYIQHLEGIYQLIFELRDGQPTIVRAYDAYNPLIARFQEQGAYEDCKACWANYNAAIHQAAASYNIPVAGVAEAWNGPNWDQDPQAMGYTKDSEHPNEVGATIIAQALRELGYEPVVP